MQKGFLPTRLTFVCEKVVDTSLLSFRGLDMAIASMRENEEALIRLSDSYALQNRTHKDSLKIGMKGRTFLI